MTTRNQRNGLKLSQALTDVLSEIFDNGLGPNPPSDVNMRSYICDQDDDDEYGDTDSNLSEDGDSDNESRKRIRRSGDGDYSSSSDPLASPGKTSLISPSRPSYTSSASRSSEGRKGNAAGSKTRSSGSSSSISSALFLSQRKQYRHVWSKKELEGLGQDDERRYMEVFFQGAHALPLGLIHKKTYEATYERQLPLLRYAVCTMGSYLSGAPNSPQISLGITIKQEVLSPPVAPNSLV
ncbi:hypothetical protein BC829DRAFT_251507 [Chytridium lagenaria]|nr:hypothetical protein BC829DRAFT_251507 [Chytridium lagenaria]